MFIYKNRFFLKKKESRVFKSVIKGGN